MQGIKVSYEPIKIFVIVNGGNGVFCNWNGNTSARSRWTSQLTLEFSSAFGDKNSHNLILEKVMLTRYIKISLAKVSNNTNTFGIALNT